MSAYARAWQMWLIIGWATGVLTVIVTVMIVIGVATLRGGRW